jgi:SAM-dependent methyltransferase
MGEKQSFQFIEALAALNYGRTKALDIIVIDRAKESLNVVAFPKKYFGYGEYSEDMVEALLAISKDYQGIKQGYTVLDIELPKNVHVEPVEGSFEYLDYGENEVDLIVATYSLMYPFLDQNEEHKAPLLSRVIKVLKPGGKLLIDLESMWILIPTLNILGRDMRHLGLLDKALLELIAGDITAFEQLLLDEYELSVQIKLYKNIVEITKLEATQRSPQLDGESNDIASRIITLPSQDKDASSPLSEFSNEKEQDNDDIDNSHNIYEINRGSRTML